MIKSLHTILTLLICCTMMQAQNFGLAFDGIDDDVEICSDAAFNIGDGFTIEAWIFASEWRDEIWRGSIVTKDMPDVSGFAFRCGSNGSLSFTMGTTNGWPEVQTGELMNPNQWYHVAAVVSSGTMTLYLNGGVVSSAPISGTAVDNNANVNIGTSTGFPSRGFIGVIDEIRIWDVARTATQISDNRTTEFTGNEANLIAYMPMNEGSGSTSANLADPTCIASFMNMDASAWVDGYSIPAKDVGVVAINGPDEVSLFERPVKMKVTLQNFGSETVSDIPVQMTLNGLPSLLETYNGTIEPGQTAEFTYTTPLNLTGNNTNLVAVATDHPDDTNGFNDGTSYRYQKPDDGNIINVLNEEQHNFSTAGQTKGVFVNLPHDMERFTQLLLHIEVECPNGGCDPWDQPAKMYVETTNGQFEIARFITPYGIECGPWTVDVTDFKTVLAGPVSFKSYVQVWGPSGWLVTADLEMVEGEETLPYQNLSLLWGIDNFVYGDPGTSYDLPEVDVPVASQTQAAHMRMTISGHGQGNTDNAAEFSQKTHKVMVNGSAVMDHFLWKGDCAQNSCSGQAGNWTPNRAGWCPGQAVDPFVVNMTSNITAGSNIALDYDLETYTNLLNTGYNGGSHTEPHYRIWSYFVERSDERYGSYSNLRSESVQIITNGNQGNPVYEQLLLNIKNEGTEDMSNVKVSYFVNGTFILEETVGQSIAAGSTYQHSFSQVNGFTGGEDHEIFAVVSHPADENISDDVSRTFVDDQLTSIAELDPALIRVYPNPSPDGQVNIELIPHFLGGELTIMDYQGKLILSKSINDEFMTFQLNHAGLYIATLKDENGGLVYKKFVVN